MQTYHTHMLVRLKVRGRGKGDFGEWIVDAAKLPMCSLLLIFLEVKETRVRKREGGRETKEVKDRERGKGNQEK